MRTRIILAVVPAVVGLMAIGGQAQAQVACGDSIATSTTLTNSIVGCGSSGLIIAADGITLNCNNHTIAGTGVPNSVGIEVNGRTSVQIKNCHVQGFADNFLVQSSIKTKLVYNTSIGNVGTAGFRLVSSFSSKLLRNIAVGGVTTSVSHGFFVDQGENNRLIKNVAAGNAFSGFGFENAFANRILRNTSINNGDAGFRFVSSGKSFIVKNRSIGNAAEGLFVVSSPGLGPGFAFKFILNAATGNGATDCKDDTSGTVTAGTENLWTSNIGDTSMPTGLCFP